MAEGQFLKVKLQQLLRIHFFVDFIRVRGN